MLNIILLIILIISVIIVAGIIIKKMPALVTLDVVNMPAEKEARFKERIISSRLERNFSKFKVNFLTVFNFFGKQLTIFSNWLQARLHETKNKYGQPAKPLDPEAKELEIKGILTSNDELNDWDDFEAKEKNYIKIIELEPRNIETFVALGNLYFSNKKYEEAKQSLTHALKLLGETDANKQAEIYYDLTLLYKENGENETGLEMIKMAFKIMPNNPRYLDVLAEMSIINKDKITALSAIEKLAEVNPENGKLSSFREQVNSL